MLLCRCSGFSPEVVFYTMGTLPALPLAPRLVRAGVSWVALEWGRPEGSPGEEQLKYTLEIQEDNSVSSNAFLNTRIKGKHIKFVLFHYINSAQRFERGTSYRLHSNKQSVSTRTRDALEIILTKTFNA